MNRYRALYRHKRTKEEKTVDTTAYNAQDAWMQTIVKLSACVTDANDWQILDLSPHPDAVALPSIFIMPEKR